MKVLVIGSGGREHALVWKIKQSPKVKKVYCVPGNGGIAEMAECHVLSLQDIPALIDFAKRHDIDLTVVGPEAPLSLGIVDEFEREGLKIFGPKKNAAIVESSKYFSKEFCTRHGIPTAPYLFFTNTKEAREFLEKKASYPIVVKADGLAAGKGVVVAQTKAEALKAVEEMLVYEKFGEAGRRIVIEEFMAGEEATFMVIADGKNFLALETSQDHKRIFDNDEGPNTGGMGAYSPAPVVTEKVYAKVIDTIIKPFIAGMQEEDRPYRGILYAGLMINNGIPRVVEFNCRFGDPEAEAILVRMESDLVEIIESALNEELSETEIKFSPKSAVCVVMSAKGYPGSYETGKLISGLDGIKKSKDVFVFHSGTRLEGGKINTNGGRVLAVTGRGKNLKEAIDKTYDAVEKISWDGVFFRKDIGKKGLII